MKLVVDRQFPDLMSLRLETRAGSFTKSLHGAATGSEVAVAVDALLQEWSEGETTRIGKTRLARAKLESSLSELNDVLREVGES